MCLTLVSPPHRSTVGSRRELRISLNSRPRTCHITHKARLCSALSALQTNSQSPRVLLAVDSNLTGGRIKDAY